MASVVGGLSMVYGTMTSNAIRSKEGTLGSLVVGVDATTSSCVRNIAWLLYTT